MYNHKSALHLIHLLPLLDFQYRGSRLDKRTPRMEQERPPYHQFPSLSLMTKPCERLEMQFYHVDGRNKDPITGRPVKIKFSDENGNPKHCHCHLRDPRI